MSLRDSWRDCTEKCVSQEHGDFLGATVTLREPTDKDLATFLSLLCGNFGTLVDGSGRSILHMAASVGRRELVQWLVQRCGADINAQDRESGYTALHRSIFYGQLNVAFILVQMGADLNICDSNYLSPIELAMKDRPPNVEFSKDLPCELYVWGTNTNFNLGTDNVQMRQQPEVLDFFRKLSRPVSIIEVHMEKFHTVMVSACGRVWTCGHGQGGRLGLGIERTVLSPMQINLGSIPKKFSLNPKLSAGQPEACMAAAVGRDHTLLLMESHSILVFGLNTHHVLGLNPPPPKLVEPQRLPVKTIENLKLPPVGVCAGRFHSVIWSHKEILTFGLNAGQLGHPKSTEKTIITPKPLNAHFYKDAPITHVAASDGATVVATGNRHIWVLHEYQRSKLSMRFSLEIEQIAVVGGYLDSELDPSNLSTKAEPLKIAAISKEGSVFLWQEKDLQMTRCILSPSRQLKVVDIHLNLSSSTMLLVTNDGEAYSGEVKPCKAKAANLKHSKGRRMPHSQPCTDGEFHILTKQMERGPIKEFLDPDVCYPVSLQRLPHAHRAIKVSSDPSGRNFSLIQTHPSVYLNNLPELPPEKQGLKQDLSDLLSETNEWDTLHDIIFEVENRRFPAHQFIVSRQSKIISQMVHDARNASVKGNIPIIKISKISPDIFGNLLHFIYTGDFSLTQPSLPDCEKEQVQSYKPNKEGRSSLVEKENENDLLDPLCQAKAAAKKLGLMKLVGQLNSMKLQDGRLLWATDINHPEKAEILEMDWKEPSEFSDILILSKDGTKFNVHKCILAARSDYFHHMLCGGWIESQGTKTLDLPLEAAILSVLFDYIYLDVTPVLDKVGAVDFELSMYALIAADQFLINPFKARCEAALASMLTLRNVKLMLELAITYNAPDLRDCCYQFVCLNLPSLLEAGALYGLPPSALEGLRDFYCKVHPRMQCRVITPYPSAPSSDYIKELAASSSIPWDEEIDVVEQGSQRKAKLSAKKKARPRRLSETFRLRHRTDSVNSDDLNTSLDPEPLDWSDLVEKEESDVNNSMVKLSLKNEDEVKEKAEKHTEWVKVMNSSKVQKTVQARLKAAAIVREEALESAPSKHDSNMTTLPVRLYPPPPQSPPQPVPAGKIDLSKHIAPEITENNFPLLGHGDSMRCSPKASVVPVLPVNEKRIVKLSQKQRKKLAAEETATPTTPVPITPRGWGHREEVSPATPPSFSLADIMQEQLQRSKQSISTASKPINIRRSSGSSPLTGHGSSPWARMDLASSPSTPPSSKSVALPSPSPETSGFGLGFSEIMADEMKQRENWTRMRAKPLHLTQIEDRAIDDLKTFYNADGASEERITVRRVLSTNVALPVWVTSKH